MNNKSDNYIRDLKRKATEAAQDDIAKGKKLNKIISNGTAYFIRRALVGSKNE